MSNLRKAGWTWAAGMLASALFAVGVTMACNPQRSTPIVTPSPTPYISPAPARSPVPPGRPERTGGGR